MAGIAYVNGRYLPKAQATVNIEDRGNQFADGVYEVLKVIDGRLSDGDRHFARLHRSLAAIEVDPPMTDRALEQVILETVRRNRLEDATVYVQISRGAAPRDHLFPRDTLPSIMMTARRLKRPDPKAYADGVGVVTAPDLRWLRCEIKSVSLLANVLAKQAAAEDGCYETWLTRDDGVVTECSASNAYIVDASGVLRTHPLSSLILGGVTRSVVLELARAEGLPVEERAFTTAEVDTAHEAFLTSTSSWVMPVVRVDGRAVADGTPGPVTRRLQQAYQAHVFGNRAPTGLSVAASAAAG